MKKLHKCGCLLLCLNFLITLTTVPTSAEDTKPETVRVGWYEDSYHMTGANGERSGYGYEYEQAIAAYTGWNYEYVKAGWTNLIEMLQKGEIDLMAAISYTDERAKTMLFSELPMGEERYYLYADLTNTNISPSNLNSLNGKRIAMIDQSVQTTQFSEWEEKNHVQTQHVFVNGFEEAKTMAKNHTIDGVISTETPAWMEVGMSAITTIGGAGIYYGISQKRQDLKEQIDNAMRSMEYDKPFYADELYQQYLSSNSVAVLSHEEKQWLEKHGAIRIGWVNHDVGVSTMTPENEELVGAVCDYVSYATDCLNNCKLTFDLHGFDTQEAEIQALKNGEIDMIFHVSQNPYEAEQNGFSLSNTAWTHNPMAITAKNNFNENEKNTIAVTRGDYLLQWYIAYHYPQWEMIEYDSEKDVCKAVRNGKADCLVIESSLTNKYINNKKYNSVSLMQPNNISFAVKRGNSTLLSILNKTLKAMPDSMLTSAVSMYDSTMRKVTLKDFVKDNLPVVTMVLISVFILILAIILELLRKSKIAEATAKEAMAQAEKANAAKSNFLFNMSHDIRTPMNAILGFAELAEKNPNNTELVHDYLDKIKVSGQGMLAILDNVLEFSRIESGKTTLEETAQATGTVFDSCLVMMNTEIEKKHHTVTVEKECACPYIYFDATRVTEIILNILSNAVKYTPDGGTIRCVLKQFPHPKDGWIYQGMSITDNGIGMSEEFQQHIFETFAREQSSTVSGVQGTGLGMGIVKKLVDLMDGTISVKSKQGEGTTVTLRMPVRIAAFEDTQPKQPFMPSAVEQLCGKRILLAEDNDLNAEIAIALLTEKGLIVDRVTDGVQCIEKIEHCEAGYYKMILMDVQMSFLNGYRTTEKIRELHDPEKANIPIVAMTANAFAEDKVKALESGMNDHVAKPVDMGVLVSVLLKYLSD